MNCRPQLHGELNVDTAQVVHQCGVQGCSVCDGWWRGAATWPRPRRPAADSPRRQQTRRSLIFRGRDQRGRQGGALATATSWLPKAAATNKRSMKHMDVKNNGVSATMKYKATLGAVAPVILADSHLTLRAGHAIAAASSRRLSARVPASQGRFA